MLNIDVLRLNWCAISLYLPVLFKRPSDIKRPGKQEHFAVLQHQYCLRASAYDIRIMTRAQHTELHTGDNCHQRQRSCSTVSGQHAASSREQMPKHQEVRPCNLLSPNSVWQECGGHPANAVEHGEV